MEGHICDNQCGDKQQTCDSGICNHKAFDAHAGDNQTGAGNLHTCEGCDTEVSRSTEAGHSPCGNLNTDVSHRTWGTRSGHTIEVVNSIVSYLQEHPVNYYGQVDTLLELIYQAYTEFCLVETPELKALINPLDEVLRSLVETDDEADSYMNLVFELCTEYERQSYIEGMKTGARLVVELMGGK